jgi:DNA-binding transcriptional LysR family regulator
MDRLDELAVLVAIIDHGSLAAAARKLRRSPPAVTRTLAALEDRAGLRLVERSTRRLAATAAGRALAERARAILGDYAAALSGPAEAPLRGLLRVTAPVQFGRRHVAPLVTGFLDAYPELQVELVLNDRNLDLIEEGLDVAVRIGPLADSALVVRRVGEVRRLLVASPAYLERRGAPARPQDLAEHETIFGTAVAGAVEWRFGSGQHARAVRLAPRLLVNDTEAQLAAARAGRGIARLLSYQAADDLAAGTLVRLLAAYEPPPLPVQLVTLRRTQVPARLRAFLDLAAESFRALGAMREEGEGLS